MIFITGARGYVGGRLTLKLAEEGYKIKALTRPGSRLNKELSEHPNITQIEGDITRLEDMQRLTEGCTEGYHLAALAKPWAKDNSIFHKINVLGTRYVLEAAQSNGVKKVVLTSSAGIFGPQINQDFITEEIQQIKPPTTEYERTKYQSVEEAKKRNTEDFQVCIVSPTRVFGPGELSVSNGVTRIFKKYREEGFRFMPGNGSSIGNYVYIDDVINGHILAMKHGRGGENYILGGENLDYISFFKAIGDATGQPRKMIGVPLGALLLGAYAMKTIADLTGKDPVITPPFVKKYNFNWGTDVTKAKSELGYTVTPFKEGLNTTLQWLDSIA